LRMQTIGDVVPENAVIFYWWRKLLYGKGEAGEFQYRVVKPINSLVFHVEANGVSSQWIYFEKWSMYLLLQIWLCS
jgi:hypothetical protein